MNRVSVSSVRTFQSCPRAYHLRYNVGLQVNGRNLDARDLGSAVHAALAGVISRLHSDGYPVGVSYAALTREVVEAWGAENAPNYEVIDLFDNTLVDPVDWREMLDTAYGVALRWLEETDPVRNYHVVELDGTPLIEYHLNCPLDATTNFTGIVDLVWEDLNTGTIDLVDFKVTSRFRQWDEYQLDNQLPVYKAALGELGVKVDTLIYWQLRPAAPKQPSLNKDGSMSRANITSDWPTYSAALVAAGLDPADYSDMCAKLDKGRDYWYSPLVYTPSQEFVDRLWQEFNAWAALAKSSTTHPGVYGYGCRNCDYANFCTATANGDFIELGEGRQYSIVED